MDCDKLLLERPFKIMANAELFDTEQHPQLTNLITDKLKNKDRFLVKVSIENERLWCIVIGRSDSHNANFNDSEEGQIFVGILDNDPINEKLSFNDMVEFQSCDVIEITDITGGYNCA